MKGIPALAGYAKFTVGYNIGSPGKEISLTLGQDNSLMDYDGVSEGRVGQELLSLIRNRGKTEESVAAPIQSLFIRIYMTQVVEFDKRYESTG